ncbi:MAG: translocation protein TolB [Syntrophorhabdus sp. PtaU1.Bin002]|nr:MAG: translocation protein TolB [Syntrophorhabdus sp. PtaU1.Bin002]
MKYLTAGICMLLSVLLISCSGFGSQDILKRFLDDCIEKQRHMVIVQLDGIKLWDPKINDIKPLLNNKYMQPHDSIISPSFCINREKLLFSIDKINERGEASANLAFLSLKDGSSDVVYESKNRIVSPILSPNNNKIAFLSEYKRENLYSLFVYDLSSKGVMKLIGNNALYGYGYNYNISWSPDGTEIAYTDTNGFLNIINIETKKNTKLIKGYNPLFSPDGKQILFADDLYKPYTPLIYDLVSKQTRKLKVGSGVYNAIWSPDGKYLIIVKMDSSLKNILKLNEWGKKVYVYDIAEKEKTELFKFDGFEYIDFK